MVVPRYLKKGDTVAITCPSKKLSSPVTEGIDLLKSWGLNVLIGETVDSSYHQFAGTDELRISDFQRFLDDDSVRAIFAARGGYGSVRIIDRLDFSVFTRDPKWVVGFSDITVIHSHIYANYKTQTIHGQMPMNVPDGTKPSLETLRKALFGEQVSYSYQSLTGSKNGSAEGVLVGGNLTLLVMMGGSVSEMDFSDKILFLEDVGEYLYSVDRMMWNLKRAGKLADLKGLIVGGFTGLKDNDIPFGQTAEEIIFSHVSEYNYPVCFDFPAGHLADNHALILGRKARLHVNGQLVSLDYLE